MEKKKKRTYIYEITFLDKRKKPMLMKAVSIDDAIRSTRVLFPKSTFSVHYKK